MSPGTALQFQTKMILPAVKQVLILPKEDENVTNLKQLDVTNLLVVSVAKINKEQLFYNPV
jgi:hypothetical protein